LYRGASVWTEDSLRGVPEQVGEDMGWFFRQWIYGTSVPAVRFSHRTVADGANVKVSCRVEISNVPDGFRIDAPVLVRFKGDRFARVRVRAVAPVTECELAPMPEAA